MSLAADLLKVADFVVGKPAVRLAAPLAPVLGRRAREGHPRRILVIRPGGIGDAVLFIPMLRELRRTWPGCRIDLLLERRNAGVLDGTGLADRLLRYDAGPGVLATVLRTPYDLVIDTEQYHCLTSLVTLATRAPRRIGFATGSRRRLYTETVPYDRQRYEVLSFLDLARQATGREPHWDPDEPFYPLPHAAVRTARKALAEIRREGRPLVAIHPGASIPERRWPPERYAEVARGLADRGAAIVVLGGPQDVRAARTIAAALGERPHVVLAGTTTLTEAAAVVAEVAVYVSADTGLLHLAYAVGTPTVHLFGPGVLSKWGPPGSRFRSVRHDVPCSPCTTYGYTPPCAQGLVCMLGIEPRHVIEEAARSLEEHTGPARAETGA